MKTQSVTFENLNGQRLSARLDMPDESRPAVYALFAHCFTCSKHFKAAARVSRSLVLHDIGVLRFDFTGLGESEGDFAETNFSSNVEDIVAAVRYLAENYQPPQILIGHSLGGTAILQAAGRVDSAVAVVTIGSPADPQHLSRLLVDTRKVIEEKGQADVMISGRRFTIKKQFIDDIEQSHMDRAINRLDKALLIMHSPQDTTVEIENAARIFKRAIHPKSFIALYGADHLLSTEADADYAGGLIAAWARKYLRTAE